MLAHRKEFFDTWANEYDTHLPSFPEYRKMVNLIAERVTFHLEKSKSEPKRVLDVGIGTGIVSSLVRENNAFIGIYGIDSSKKMMEKITNKGFKLKAVNMENMLFPNSFFDAVYANLSMHHSNQKEKVLERINCFLKPNGLLVLGEVVVDFPFGHPKFFDSVVERWAFTARHALKNSGKNAALRELEVMFSVAKREGEFLETQKNWEKLVSSHFKLLEKIQVDKKLGYYVLVAKKQKYKAKQ